MNYPSIQSLMIRSKKTNILLSTSEFLRPGRLYCPARVQSHRIGHIAVPSVSIETSNTTADEGGPVVPLTIVRSGAANGSVDVSFSLAGTAAVGADYTYEPSSLHFARGERQKTINFTLRSDSAVESDETIIISLTDITGATPGERTVSQISVRDTTPIVTPTPVPTEQPTPTPTPDSHSHTYPYATACVAFYSLPER